MSMQVWLRKAAVVGLFFISSTATADSFSNVHVTSISAGDASTDFEVVFDRKVCLSSTPNNRARAEKLQSVNHEVLFSAVMAAFLSNFTVRVQTANDGTCHIQSFEISRR